MKVLITSGATSEYIDSVRVLTNISTGKLGARIATEFYNRNLGRHWKEQDVITYVSPRSAVKPRDEMGALSMDYIEVTNVKSLMEVMEREVPKHDVVIHAMAVSDFTFELNEAVKIGSNSAEDFVEFMRKTIRKNPKVISNFRDWNPKAILVGFKFTVGKEVYDLVDIARSLLISNRLDMVFSNDKEMMNKEKEHVGFLVEASSQTPLRGKDEIAKGLCDRIESLFRNRV